MPIGRGTRLAFVVLIIVGVWLFPYAPAVDQALGKSPNYKQLRLFRQVMQIVQKNYVKEVTDKDLIQGAINGMLQSLDPHSSYLTEDLFKELQVETKGEFGGLGIEITLESGTSLAAPIVAAIAALIWQSHPRACAQTIRSAILASGHLAGSPNNEVGHGLVDAERALFTAGTIPGPQCISLSSYKPPPSSIIPALSESPIVGRRVYNLIGQAVRSGAPLWVIDISTRGILQKTK